MTVEPTSYSVNKLQATKGPQRDIKWSQNYFKLTQCYHDKRYDHKDTVAIRNIQPPKYLNDLSIKVPS